MAHVGEGKIELTSIFRTYFFEKATKVYQVLEKDERLDFPES